MINSLFFLGGFFLFLPESLCFCLLDHKQTTSYRRTLVLLKNFQDLFLYFQWKLEFFVYMIDWAYFLPELTFFLRRSCNFRVMWGRLNCRKDEWTVVRRNSLLLRNGNHYFYTEIGWLRSKGFLESLRGNNFLLKERTNSLELH